MKSFLFLIFLTLISCVQKDNPELEWARNGTLHDKMIMEWETASNENRLATCADFIVRLKESDNKRYVTVTDIKYDATNLKICIDEATKNNKYADNMKVSEVAVSCYLLMNYQ